MEVNRTSEPVQSTDRHTSTIMNKVKAKYTSVPVQYDVRRSQQKQEDGRTTQRSTKHTKQTKTRTKTPRQQDKPKPAKTPDNTAGRQDPTKRGCRGKKASGDQQKGKSRRPGRQQRQEGEGSTSQEGGRVRLYRCPKGVLDHPRANTSVPKRGAHEQHPPHGVEGKAPHRAEAFVAMKRSEDRSQSTTTRHARGMATGPLQIQPDIRREGPADN